MESINFDKLVKKEKNQPMRKLSLFAERTIGDAVLDLIYLKLQLAKMDEEEKPSGNIMPRMGYRLFSEFINSET